MTTIKDIARLSGYSIGTVSRVINDHPDVSPQARKKILAVIREQRFQPNTNAKLLKQTVSTEITVIVKGTNNAFLESILEEVQKNLKQNEEDVNVMFIDETADEVALAVQRLSEKRPKGFIFLGGNLQSFKKDFDKIDIPSVLIGETAEELGFENLSSFATDDYAAAAAAIDYLIHCGHTRIGLIGGSADRSNGEVGTRRLEGALHQMRRNNIPFSLEQQYEPGRFSMESGYRAMQRLLERNRNLSGVFCLGDTVAIGALRGARDMGLIVPQDISIVGFDGIEYTRYSVPRIATVQQDIKELARAGVEDLLLRLNYKRSAVHNKIVFRVITGESITHVKGE